MHETITLDSFDLKILAALQRDGRLTNQELAQQVNLSPSQCSRRRMALERAGVIGGYRAVLDPVRLGYGLTVFINVMLNTHNRDNAARFAALAARIPNILEVHALTGEMDYLIKLLVRDLSQLSDLINGELLPHQAVQTVKTSIVLETVKQSHAVPVNV